MSDKLKLEVLFASIDKLTSPLKSIRGESKGASKEIVALRKKLGDLQKTSDRISKSGANGAKFMAGYQDHLQHSIHETNVELSKQYRALEKINKKAKQLNAAQSKYNSTMRKRDKVMNAGVSTGVAGAAILAPIGGIVAEYAIAEDAATELKVAMMDSAGQIPKTYKEINVLANQLGNKLPGTTSDYQNMMTMLIRQGMPAERVLGGLGKATAYLGVQLKMPMDQTAKFLSQLQDATGTTEKEMMGLSDNIQRTFNLGVDPTNMLGAFKGLGTVMDIMHKKGLEGTKALTPFVVMMDQTGMAGESAGNAIRKMVTRSLDLEKLGKANAMFKGINLDFTDGHGAFGGMDNLMAQLDKLKKLNDVDRLAYLKKLYGDDAETNQVLSKIIEKGIDGYKEVQAKLSAQADLEKRVNLQLGTLSSLWDAATGTFTNFMVALGESISPELKGIVTWLGSVAEGMQVWATENPGIASAILKTVAVLGLLLAGISVLALGIAAIMGPFAMFRFAMVLAGPLFSMLSSGVGGLITVVMKFGKAFLWLGRIMLTNPIGLIITGIALAAFLIYKYWDDIVPFFKNLWDKVTQKFDAFVNYFKTIDWSAIGMNIISGIESGIDFMTGGLYSKIKSISSGMVDAAKEALGIHSPSRVFSELGGFTMQGLAVGLNKGEGGVLSQINSTAKRMALLAGGVAITGTAMAGGVQFDTRPALSAAATGGGASTNVYNITINANDADTGKDIAQQVADAIAKLDRKRATAARSSLRDDH